MQPALYFAVGDTSREFWQHFALHIPFYTHFTSPIRRYPDVLVHRLLQATIDGEKAVQSFPLDPRTLQSICDHCNEKKEASRAAQQRGDEVFLALYLKRSPLKSQLGIVLSVGVKTFTVFVPSIGLNKKVFLDEHDKSLFSFTSYEEKGEKRIKVESRRSSGADQVQWTSFNIGMFTKLFVTCACKDKFPIDVKVIMEKPWIPERHLK
jgi:DIS3-like exonuclease 2